MNLEVQISWQAQHFENLEVQISWQAQHFVNLEVQISWQAQHFENLEVQISWQAQQLVNFEVQISWQAQHFVNLEVQISWRRSTLSTSKCRFRGRHSMVNLEVQIAHVALPLNLRSANKKLRTGFLAILLWEQGRYWGLLASQLGAFLLLVTRLCATRVELIRNARSSSGLASVTRWRSTWLVLALKWP